MKQSKKFKDSKTIIFLLICLTSTCSGFFHGQRRDLRRIYPTSRYQQREFRSSRNNGEMNILTSRNTDGSRMTENDSILGNLYDMRSFRTGSIENRRIVRIIRIDENNNAARQWQSNPDENQSIVRSRRLKNQLQIFDNTKKQIDVYTGSNNVDSSRRDIRYSDRNNEISINDGNFVKSVTRRQHAYSNEENSNFFGGEINEQKFVKRNIPDSKAKSISTESQNIRRDYAVEERRRIPSDTERNLYSKESERKVTVRKNISMEDRRRFEDDNQRRNNARVERKSFRNNIERGVINNSERRMDISSEDGMIFLRFRNVIRTTAQRGERRNLEQGSKRIKLSGYSERRAPSGKEYNNRHAVRTLENDIRKDVSDLTRANCFRRTCSIRELSRSDSTRQIRNNNSILFNIRREFSQGYISDIHKFRNNNNNKQNNDVRDEVHFRVSFRRVLRDIGNLNNEKISSKQNGGNRREIQTLIVSRIGSRSIGKNNREFLSNHQMNSRGDVVSIRETSRIRRELTLTRDLNKSFSARESDRRGLNLNGRVHRTDGTRLISGSPRTSDSSREHMLSNNYRITSSRRNLKEGVDMITSPKMEIFFNRIETRRPIQESMSSKPYVSYPETNEDSEVTNSAWVTLANTAKVILSIYLIGQIFMDQSPKKIKSRFYKTMSPLGIIKEKIQ